MRTHGRGKTKVLVDGLLTTNGLTMATGAGATLVVVADPAPTLDVTDLIIKAAIPLAAALIINVVSRIGDYILFKKKLKAEAEMRVDGGSGTGGLTGGHGGGGN